MGSRHTSFEGVLGLGSRVGFFVFTIFCVPELLYWPH